MNQKYIEILNMLLDKQIGENLFEVTSDKGNDRIFINIITVNGARSNCASIFTENGSFILSHFKNDYKFNSLEMFSEMANQIIENELKPKIIEAYKRKAISKIPEKMNLEIPKVDFTLINAEWIIKKFKESSRKEGNGEDMINPEILLGKETLSINFLVDCGRRGIHKRNSIYINDTGLVNVNLCEALEGGGIEEHLENNIKKLLNIK